MTNPDPVRYLDDAAASPPGRDYKRRLLDALDVRPGHTALDVGCGPATDLPALAAAVTSAGAVIAVDHDAAMVAEARRRTSRLPWVEIRTGDAHALPVDAASVDRARADRVLQHIADPAGAVAELARVLRPGGMLGLAEPDWHTFAIDDEDTGTSDGFARFLAGQVRNPAIGRQLARLAVRAGCRVRTVDATAITFLEFGAADQILGLERNTDRAVRAGQLDAAAAGQWLDRLRDGPFLAAFTLFAVTAELP